MSRVRQSSCPTVPSWVVLRQVTELLLGSCTSSPHSSRLAGSRE